MQRADNVPGLSRDVCIAELVPDKVLSPFEVRIQHLVQPLDLVAVPTRARGHEFNAVSLSGSWRCRGRDRYLFSAMGILVSA